MNNPAKLPKWPFFLGDLLLVGASMWIVQASASPLGLWHAGACLVGFFAGACVSLLPFLMEYRAEARLVEMDGLATVTAQTDKWSQIQKQLGSTTAQWQALQDQSKGAIQAAEQIAQRIQTEAKAFVDFLQKANSAEKNHLRLEVEKLKRAEKDWMQVTVCILDHIFALNQAANRSGQPTLIAQLNQFQHACRDAARRVGLVPFAPRPQEAFDAGLHQPATHPESAQPAESIPAGTRIHETLATGYTYQGQLIRKALVAVQEEEFNGGNGMDGQPGESATPATDSLDEATAAGGKTA
jgi:molecular chaperone GrpE (heat shock protein)